MAQTTASKEKTEIIARLQLLLDVQGEAWRPMASDLREHVPIRVLRMLETRISVVRSTTLMRISVVRSTTTTTPQHALPPTAPTVNPQPRSED